MVTTEKCDNHFLWSGIGINSIHRKNNVNWTSCINYASFCVKNNLMDISLVWRTIIIQELFIKICCAYTTSIYQFRWIEAILMSVLILYCKPIYFDRPQVCLHVSHISGSYIIIHFHQQLSKMSNRSICKLTGTDSSTRHNIC